MTLTTRVAPWLFLFAAIARPLSAQARPAPATPAQPYAADSKLGELYLLGRTFSTANKSFVDEAEHLLVSVESAGLALRFPTREKLVVAGENQQLLLLSGTIKNPQKAALDVNGGSMMTIRFFGNVRAAPHLYGHEITINSDSLKSLKLTLKPGESARYTMALRIPSDQPALQLATLRRGAPIRKYDFEPVATSVASVFARTGSSIASSARSATGETFDLDAFDVKVNSVRELQKIGSYSASANKHLYAAEVQVTNRMLLAEPWGWQYCTPDLKDAAGKSITWSRDMLDAQSGQTFSRDLSAGETATVVYVFSSEIRMTPAALTLSMLTSKRQVVVALK
ncbi:MAG: hypothetical protein ABIP93_18020 [Gemmatimonadaceae bacterium]